MRKYIIAAIILMAIMIVIVFFSRPRQQPTYHTGYTAPNMQYPYSPDNQTIYFFTGSAFASYNIQTHTTKTLSLQLSLPFPSVVRWSKSGVLFKAGNSTVIDDLYPASTAFLLDKTQEYWWRYDFASNHIFLLHTNNHADQISDARWSDENGSDYVYSIGSAIYRSDGAVVLKDNSPITAIDYAHENTYIYEVVSNQNTVVKAFNPTINTQTLLTGAVRNVVVNKGGRYLTYVTNFNLQSSDVSPGDLMLYDRQTSKTKKIFGSFLGIVSSNNESSILIYNKPLAKLAQLWAFNLRDHKLSNLTGDIADIKANPTHLFSFGLTDLGLVSETHSLSFFSSSAKTFTTTPDNTAVLQKDTYEDGFNINYRLEEDTDVYYVYITKNPYSAYQTAALNYIRKHHIDPNSINIKWYRNDNVVIDRTLVDVSVPPNYFVSNED